MGACMSSGAIEVSEEDKRLHREAEKSLKEVRVSLFVASKVLLISIFSGESEVSPPSQGPFTRFRGLREVDHPEANAPYPPCTLLSSRN